jgi:hypothetical protein
MPYSTPSRSRVRRATLYAVVVVMTAWLTVTIASPLTGGLATYIAH